MTTDTLTVTIDGKEHKIYREEILKSDDVHLKTTFVLRDATVVDLELAEKAVHQLRHGLSSIDNTLMAAAVRYVNHKNDYTPEKNGD